MPSFSGSINSMVKNVLFVIPRGSNPGAMQFVLRLATALNDAGVNVETFFIRTSFLPHIFFRQGLEIRKKSREGGFDLVNAQYGTYTGLITTLFSALPVVVTFRGSDLNFVPSERSLKWLLQHLTSQIAALLACGVICVSRHIHARIWTRNKYFAVIPSSIDLDRFVPRDLGACRQELGWEQHQSICIFFTGSNAQVKRLDMAQKLAEELERRGSVVLLKIIEYMEPEQVALMLNAADCLVFLSDYEGSPNIVREACACNLPVVSVEVGDVSDVLIGIDGCQITTREIAQIADAVEDVGGARKRTKGREIAAAYSGCATAARTLRLYQDVLGWVGDDRQNLVS